MSDQPPPYRAHRWPAPPAAVQPAWLPPHLAHPQPTPPPPPVVPWPPRRGLSDGTKIAIGILVGIPASIVAIALVVVLAPATPLALGAVLIFMTVIRAPRHRGRQFSRGRRR